MFFGEKKLMEYNFKQILFKLEKFYYRNGSSSSFGMSKDIEELNR